MSKIKIIEFNNNAFDKIKIKNLRPDYNGLSYFERTTQKSQPHEMRNKDWSHYFAIQFADTFLPKVDLIYDNAFRFYDGAEIIDKRVKILREELLFTKTPNLHNIIAFSYPKDVEASQKKDLVQVSKHESCIFIEVDEDDNALLSFKLGTELKEVIKTNTSRFENSVYSTSIAELKQHFGDSITQKKFINLIFKFIGEDQTNLYGNSDIGVLESLLRKEKVKEFVFVSKCGLNNTFAIHGNLEKGFLNFKRIDIGDVKSMTSLEVSPKDNVLLFKQGDIWINSGYFIPKLDSDCENSNSQISDNEIKSIKNAFENHFNFSNKNGNEKLYYDISSEILKKLDNDFYKDVKLNVNLTVISNSYSETTENNNIDQQTNIKIPKNSYTYNASFKNSDEPSEVILNINIGEKGQVSIKHDLSQDYLKEFKDKWQKEINNRGLDKHINIEELRQQVIDDFKDAETENSFFQKFIQDAKALLSENIGGYVEAIQSTQKVAKNVWEHGEINKDTWHSTDPKHQEWPKYMQLNPLVGGGTDGVIDEIAGIPMAIKGIYGIVTDEEQRKAFSNLFTKDGAKQMIDDLVQEAKDTWNDNDRLQHTGAKTTVSVGATVLGIGIFTKTGKLGKVFGEMLEKVSDYVNPKVLEYLEQIKKGKRHIDTDEALAKLTKELGDDLFEEVILDAGENSIKKGRKLTLDELNSFWKRGNDFNKKSKDLGWYEINEIWMTHPTKVYPKGHKNAGKPRRFRLDSWDNLGEGKIVSRKATNLSEINEETFIRYCKEISEKYPSGSSISNKSIGDKLFGKYYLEIPDSNLKFKNIDEYIKKAKDLGVELIFKPE